MMKTTRFIYLKCNLPFYFTVILCSFFFTSCYVNRYQKVETKWKDSTSSDLKYSSPDSLITVSHDLWSSGGWIRSNIKNNSDSILYLVQSHTFDIFQKSDSFPLLHYKQCVVMDSLGNRYISQYNTLKTIEKGRDIPIPPKGVAVLFSNKINNYLNLNYKTNDEAKDQPKIYTEHESPFHFTKQVAYSKSATDDIHIAKYSFFVNEIQPYKFIWSAGAIPMEQRSNNAFYVESKRPSIVTYLGILGLVVGSALLDEHE